MNPTIILFLVIAYFIILFAISFITGKEDNNQIFFKANNKAPWILVAFGMIGTTLSGVTFISVPGTINSGQFSYYQLVIGTFAGLFVVAYVLIPLYYKLGVTSIYQYLESRFDGMAQKSGAAFFLISRTMGAAFRIYLVALAFQFLIADYWQVPFEITVIISIFMIWLYTHKGGIKTIVWTDTLQTFFMLLALILGIWLIASEMNFSFIDLYTSSEFLPHNKIFYFDDILGKNHFMKSFIGGVFLAITMIGMDQDMMQKNLTCKNTKDAQKNVVSFAFAFLIVNYFFLILGVLLLLFLNQNELQIPRVEGSARPDLIFPYIATQGGLGLAMALSFVIGLIAAAYSSADSALTSLTTSICVDFMDIDKIPQSTQKYKRKKIHIIVSIALALIVISFHQFIDDSIVNELFTVATFTYGPMLGLFSFGILTKRQINTKVIPVIAILSILICYFLSQYDKQWLGGYQLGYELLLVNGLLTYLGLYLVSSKK